MWKFNKKFEFSSVWLSYVQTKLGLRCFSFLLTSCFCLIEKMCEELSSSSVAQIFHHTNTYVVFWWNRICFTSCNKCHCFYLRLYLNFCSWSFIDDLYSLCGIVIKCVVVDVASTVIEMCWECYHYWLFFLNYLYSSVAKELLHTTFLAVQDAWLFCIISSLYR